MCKHQKKSPEGTRGAARVLAIVEVWKIKEGMKLISIDSFHKSDVYLHNCWEMDFDTEFLFETRRTYQTSMVREGLVFNCEIIDW